MTPDASPHDIDAPVSGGQIGAVAGAGQVAKSANQLIVGVTIAAVAEALAHRPASTPPASATPSAAASPAPVSWSCTDSA